MSKKKKLVEIDPSGLSIEDIIKLDPTHVKGLTNKSLAVLTSRLVSAYNKRAKRLEKAGLELSSPAYRGLIEAGKTRLSVKGKNRNELISVYADAKRFLTERTTSSVSGTRKLQREISKRIGYEFQDKKESTLFWGVMDRLKEKGIGIDKRSSTDVQREVADLLFNEGKDPYELLKDYGILEKLSGIGGEPINLDLETGELFGFGGDDEDEQDEYTEEDWDW